MKRALCAASILLGVAVTAAAQTPPPTAMFTHGSTLNLFAGGATAPSTTAPLGGAGVGWELTPRFAIEGSGEWLEWGSATHGFAAALTAQTGLVGRRSFMPFLTGGVGLYHAQFDHPEAGMPPFYARRMTAVPVVGTIAHFTDPTLVFGGGVNAFVNRHWAIRPDVQEMAVLRDARSYLVTTVAIHLAYHFEEHPITPRAR